jgi:NodT family efflux transporter outer membrane factor (OMF) lipoprotein
MAKITRSSTIRPLAGLALTLLAGGCAVGPDFHRPALSPAAGYSKAPPSVAEAGGVAQAFEPGADLPGQWWTLYQSPALNRLVEAALKSNPDIEAAQAALRAAHQSYLAQRGALLPTVDLGLDASREKASGALSPPLSTSQLQFDLYNAQVSVGFTPDVFGGIRRQTEAVAAQVEAQKFTTEATYLTLTANVVTAALQAAGLREQIEAARTAIKDESDILDLLRRQQALGQASGGDVAAQETLLAQAEQALPSLNKQLTQTLDQLAALTGRSPAEALDEVLDLNAMSLPASLPVSLPAKLVGQRPDIRIAEANLHAASAGVGVAIAARLPSLSLTATAGGASTNFGQLLDQPNTFWTIGAGLSQPIFAGGALYHRQKAAEATLDQAKAQYRSAVITALQNVADTLGALKADADAQNAADRAERAARTSLAIARKQFEIGDASRVPLLNAEQAYQQALVARAQARANRYADTAALFQALGGGWWNRTET